MNAARVALSGALALLIAGGTLQAAEQVPVPITIQEEAGIARRGEPVAVSLPFAQGALRQPQVRITDAGGRPVEAQFECSPAGVMAASAGCWPGSLLTCLPTAPSF